MPPDPRALAASSRLITICGLMGIAAVVLALWTARAGTLRPVRELPEHVRSPILALELIRSADLLPRIVKPRDPAPVTAARLRPRDERAQLIYATRLDFAFIGAYAMFLVLAGLLVARTHTRLLGGVVIFAAIGAAAFDVLENLAILDLLQGVAGPTPRGRSLVKWQLFFIAIGVLAPFLVDRSAKTLQRWIGYLGCALAIVAVVEGTYGVLLGNDKVIEAAGRRGALAFGLMVLFVATRHWLRAGLLPALNRLADSRLLRPVVDWPNEDKNETVGKAIPAAAPHKRSAVDSGTPGSL